MKLRVVGWTYYDDDWQPGTHGWAARYAIIDEIKKNGYLFSGMSHQKGDNCAPVLNDGKIYCYSHRGWGGIMAEAHGYNGRMDYAKFAFDADPDKAVLPQERIDEDAFTLELNLNERFELEVSPSDFGCACKEHSIILDDIPKLRYLDNGDTLSLLCGDKRADFTVLDVERKRDFTEEKLFELECAFYDFSDSEKLRRAEEEFNSAKIVMTVKLKPVDGAE